MSRKQLSRNKNESTKRRGVSRSAQSVTDSDSKSKTQEVKACWQYGHRWGSHWQDRRED